MPGFTKSELAEKALDRKSYRCAPVVVSIGTGEGSRTIDASGERTWWCSLTRRARDADADAEEG